MEEKELRFANAVYVQSQIACALIEMEAMKAENMKRERGGFAQAYGEEQFMILIEKYGLGHNVVVPEIMR